MTKLYQKSEISFAILWIVVYVVLSGIADQLSEAAGVMKSVTAALHIAMSLVLIFWIRKNDLGRKYGFCRSAVPAKRFLYYLPLVLIASTARFSGSCNVYYQHVLRRLFGRSYFPRTAVPGNGKR